MKIEIKYEKFNNEFQADVEISKGNIKYIATDYIKNLFEELYEIAWNFRGYL